MNRLRRSFANFFLTWKGKVLIFIMGLTGVAMKKTSANDVADFFLWFVSEHGDTLTNKKLQKLLYYAQAWHLAIFDDTLFSDRIEAWVFGPVVPDVYHRFKKHDWNPLPPPKSQPELSKSIKDHLEEVFNAYGRFSAWDLERMTHSEPPWQEARKGLQPDENSQNVITTDLMKQYYKKALNG